MRSQHVTTKVREGIPSNLHSETRRMLSRLEANADPNLSSQDEDTAGDMSSAFLGDVPRSCAHQLGANHIVGEFNGRGSFGRAITSSNI